MHPECKGMEEHPTVVAAFQRFLISGLQASDLLSQIRVADLAQVLPPSPSQVRDAVIVA